MSGTTSSQKIYSILSFDSDDRRGANVAILSGSHSGWRVVVLHRIMGGLDPEWRSGKLSDDFDVSDSRNLKIESMDDGEQVVEFSGCAAHDCGGLDGGIFGVLLYSPRSKQVFFAHFDTEKTSLATASALCGSQRTPTEQAMRSTKQHFERL